MIHEKMLMRDYLKLPAVSASVIKALVDDCPAMAFHESYLNLFREPDDTDASDAGSIGHSIMLEGGPGSVQVFEPSDYPNAKGGGVATGWTNNSIREARDIARAEGKIPVLAEDMAGINSMVEHARKFIDSLKETEPAIWAAFQKDGGNSEMTVTCNYLGVDCRIRPDRISTDRKLIVDAKFVTTGANPERYARAQMVANGGYISAAFYQAICQSEFGTLPSYVFLIVDQNAPHLCSLVGCDPAMMALGLDKVHTGLRLWKQCVATNVWPAYPNRIVYPELPPYVEAAWVDKTMSENGLEFYEKLFKGRKA